MLKSGGVGRVAAQGRGWNPLDLHVLGLNFRWFVGRLKTGKPICPVKTFSFAALPSLAGGGRCAC